MYELPIDEDTNKRLTTLRNTLQSPEELAKKTQKQIDEICDEFLKILQNDVDGFENY